MGLKFRRHILGSKHCFLLKSDQNGIEITHLRGWFGAPAGLKSDQNGIEIHQRPTPEANK